MRKAVNQILPLKNSRMLANSFAVRSKISIDEFYIQLDDPHKTYRPGDEVSGQIILILKKNVPDVLINLSLIGLIKVNSTSPLRSVKKQYLFNHKIIIYGDTANNENALTKGEHRFPFIVKLPKKNVYTSISFEKGEIKYYLKCDLMDKNIEETPVLSCEKLLSLLKPINLMLLPEAQPKYLSFKNTKKSLRKTISSTSSINSTESMEAAGNPTTPGSSSTPNEDEIKIKMFVPSMGFLKGESIPVKLNVKHFKRISNVNGIIVTLIRICRLDLGEQYEVQSYRKDLSQSIVPLITDPTDLTSEISTSLRVPVDCFPTIVSNLVSFQYYIEVLINLSNSKVQMHQKNEVIDDEVIQTDKHEYIYNVDKLKKMKNILTLTSEIIIGTERKSISKLKKRIRQRQPMSPSESLSPASKTASVATPQSVFGVNSPQSPATTSSPPSSSPTDTSTSSNTTSPMVIPNILSPPLQQSPRSQQKAEGTNTGGQQLTEKQLLALREQALLPSEPPTSASPHYHLHAPAGDYTDPPPLPTPVPSDYRRHSGEDNSLDHIMSYQQRPPGSSYEDAHEVESSNNDNASEANYHPGTFVDHDVDHRNDSLQQLHLTSDDHYDDRNVSAGVRHFTDFMNDDASEYSTVPVYKEQEDDCDLLDRPNSERSERTLTSS